MNSEKNGREFAKAWWAEFYRFAWWVIAGFVFIGACKAIF